MESYFILHSSDDGTTIDMVPKEELSKRITPDAGGCTYYGHRQLHFLERVPQSDKGCWWNVPENSVLIIKGQIVIPQPVSVVTEFKVLGPEMREPYLMPIGFTPKPSLKSGQSLEMHFPDGAVQRYQLASVNIWYEAYAESMYWADSGSTGYLEPGDVLYVDMTATAASRPLSGITIHDHTPVDRVAIDPWADGVRSLR